MACADNGLLEGLGNRIGYFRIILKLPVRVLKVSSGCRKDTAPSSSGGWWD
jgi:hypothetical protein